MRKASQSHSVQGCRLRRADLDALFELVLRGIGENPRVNVEIEHGITTVINDSLSGALDELGPVDSIRSLSIHAFSNLMLPERQRSTIWVKVSDDSVYVSVDGPEDDWVVGKAAAIVALLEGTRATPVIRPLVPILLWILIAFGLYLPSFFARGDARATLSALTTVLVIADGIFYLWVRRRWRTRVVFADLQSKWWNWDRVIGVAGFVVALAALILAWWTWQHPVK